MATAVKGVVGAGGALPSVTSMVADDDIGAFGGVFVLTPHVLAFVTELLFWYDFKSLCTPKLISLSTNSHFKDAVSINKNKCEDVKMDLAYIRQKLYDGRIRGLLNDMAIQKKRCR